MSQQILLELRSASPSSHVLIVATPRQPIPRRKSIFSVRHQRRKIGQMSQITLNTSDRRTADDAARSGRVGSFLFITDPAEINRLQHIAVDESRLRIPMLFGLDVVHGFRSIYLPGSFGHTTLSIRIRSERFPLPYQQYASGSFRSADGRCGAGFSRPHQRK